MKFLRIGPPGRERPAVIGVDGTPRDLSDVVTDISGGALATLAGLSTEDVAGLPHIEGHGRIGACLATVPNILAIGLNYVRHAEETGNAIPEEPLVFAKHTSSLAGPFDEVEIPPGCDRVDWEVELGVVIGRPAYRVSEADALSHVFGYCTVNDLSERDLQLRRGGQWLKGKSNPGFAPAGPWLVRADAVPDPQRLGLRLDRNGETMQSSSTADMIFGVARVVSYLSEFMRLVPGDLIVTGTPEGIGSRRTPPTFLGPGDAVSAEVEGLGRQEVRIVAARRSGEEGAP
jgi:2-keto-4-pentenoate hydratase/2-oxohepta-3-ene-1,7-dioic acid hydratase in catechol pathway